MTTHVLFDDCRRRSGEVTLGTPPRSPDSRDAARPIFPVVGVLIVVALLEIVAAFPS